MPLPSTKRLTSASLPQEYGNPAFVTERSRQEVLHLPDLELSERTAGRERDLIRLGIEVPADNGSPNVVDYYDRGANSNPGLDAELRPLKLTVSEKRSLVAFLSALTGTVSGR
jgi:hypothetical protein